MDIDLLQDAKQRLLEYLKQNPDANVQEAFEALEEVLEDQNDDYVEQAYDESEEDMCEYCRKKKDYMLAYS